jgi:hypothetical protein
MMSRRWSPVLALCALLPHGAMAQMGVSLSLEHTLLLRGEHAMATVNIRNEGEVPFVTDAAVEDPVARVRIELAKGADVNASRLDGQPLAPALAVLPGETERVAVDLARRYDISQPQGYTARAIIDWNGRKYISSPVHFDVVEGLPLSSVARGLPGDTEHLRRYTLRYLTREQSEHLFLCIDEDDGMVNCGVFDLGPIIRVFAPQIDVGRDGTVTVLHLAAKNEYTRSTLRSWPDRVTLVDQATEKGAEAGGSRVGATGGGGKAGATGAGGKKD